MSVSYIWLLVGVLFMAAEAMGAAGVGLFFAGIGALLVGGLLSFAIIADDDTVIQFIVFFIGTAVSAALLWKPMQRLRFGKNSSQYTNIVGQTAYVGSAGLNRKSGGEVTWSGTIMLAELAPGTATESLEAGSVVTIVDVAGSKLIVSPKG